MAKLTQKGDFMKNRAFTLAEVLITLGIIGVVAALTIPSLINSYKDKQFKTAYKKAYSDMQNVFLDAIFEGSLTRNKQFDVKSTEEEFGIMKEKFKIVTDCGKEISACWGEGELIGEGSSYPKDVESTCFTDASGRSWCTYYNAENIFLVDTNGLKLPNKFGKDRWYFVPANENGNRTGIAANYKKIAPFINSDINNKDVWCHYPPCNFKSWLYE